jgi:hypothetical protein
MLGVFELHVNKAHHNTIDSLVVTIKEVKGNLDKDTVAKACRCFGPGLRRWWRQTAIF